MHTLRGPSPQQRRTLCSPSRHILSARRDRIPRGPSRSVPWTPARVAPLPFSTHNALAVATSPPAQRPAHAYSDGTPATGTPCAPDRSTPIFALRMITTAPRERARPTAHAYRNGIPATSAPCALERSPSIPSLHTIMTSPRYGSRPTPIGSRNTRRDRALRPRQVDTNSFSVEDSLMPLCHAKPRAGSFRTSSRSPRICDTEYGERAARVASLSGALNGVKASGLLWEWRR